MSKIPVSASVSKAWELTKSNLGFLVLVTFISWLAPSAITQAMKILRMGMLSGLVNLVVSELISIGLVVIALKIVDKKKPLLEDLYQHYNLLVNFLVANILLGLMVVIGLVFLIIPGIYLALKYQFTMFLIVDKKMKIMEAFKASAKMTEGKLMDLFLLMLISIGLTIVGAVALGIGLLVTTPLIMLTYAVVYRSLSGAK